MDSRLNQLIEWCSEFEIEASEEKLTRCLYHLDLVIEKNKKINLTRIVNEDEALVLHILDSLLLLNNLNDSLDGPLLDMGTGAGFPGIPLAITSGRQTVLMDSVGKKVDAVAEFIEELELKDVACIHSRLEEAAIEFDAYFSVVVARALASLPVLIEYACPYLKKNGCFIVTKGNPSNEEIIAGNKAAEICGMKLISCNEFDLPNDLGHREILVYQKVSSPKIKLPRQNGLAKKKPLA